MKFVIFLAIIALFYQKPLNPKKVVLAIDCGSPKSKKSAVGFTYQKDSNFYPEDTVAADYTLNQEVSSQVIKFTRDPDVYMSERHGYDSFNYKLTLTKEGTYVLILKFAEMYFKQKGKRIFHINFGKTRVVDSLDVYAKTGRFAAFDEYIEFQYEKGEILFKKNPIPDALVNGNQLFVEFEKTEFDNPFVHGLMLYQGSLKDTDYYELPEIRANFDSYLKEEQNKKEEERQRKNDKRKKRKEKVKIRNDLLNELEEEFEETDTVEEGKHQSIRQLLVGPLGVGLLSFACLVFYALQEKLTRSYLQYQKEKGKRVAVDTKEEREQKEKKQGKPAGKK